jgi:hypothetical protein
LFSEAHTVFLELQKFAVEFSNKPELMREVMCASSHLTSSLFSFVRCNTPSLFSRDQARKKSSKNYRVVINILINNLQRKLERLNGKVEMDDESGTRRLAAELSTQLPNFLLFLLLFCSSCWPSRVQTNRLSS